MSCVFSSFVDSTSGLRKVRAVLLPLRLFHKCDAPQRIETRRHVHTFFSIHPRIASNTCLRLFSSIMKCPLPWMPLSFNWKSSASHPACFRNATIAGLCRSPRSLGGDIRDGNALQIFQLPRRLRLQLVALHLSRHQLRRIRNRRIVNHRDVRQSPRRSVARTARRAPSTLTIAFTSFGRALATIQLNGPPAECTCTIAGPILSSNSAPRLAHSVCAITLSCGAAFAAAIN